MQRTIKKVLKRYRIFFILVIINIGLVITNRPIGCNAIQITWRSMLEMLSVLPPIFILLGLFDVWVQKETIIKLIGERSGLIGNMLAFLLGSVAAGPLYAAFPIALVLLKKGSTLSNMLIFLGAWSTTKIPMLLFETASMGWQFTLIRFLINIPIILIIANITQRLMKDQAY